MVVIEISLQTHTSLLQHFPPHIIHHLQKTPGFLQPPPHLQSAAHFDHHCCRPLPRGRRHCLDQGRQWSLDRQQQLLPHWRW